MFRATMFATVAVAALGSSTGAFASAMDNDPNTGLWSYLYYGPIADLQQQGLPISQAAKDYIKQHHLTPTAQAPRAFAAPQSSGVMLLEDRTQRVAPRRVQQPAVYPAASDDKQSGHLW